MAGARAVGATVFLTPAANCPDTKGAVPAGLRLARVSTLRQALNDLTAIRQAGQCRAADQREPCRVWVSCGR